MLWVLEDQRQLGWGQQQAQELLEWPLCHSCQQLLCVPLATYRLGLGRQPLMAPGLTGLRWAASQVLVDHLRAAAQLHSIGTPPLLPAAPTVPCCFP